MAEIKDQTLSGDVAIDGNSYVNVVFDGATLIYDGGRAPTFQGCQFAPGCSVTFQEKAGNTLAFLRSMAHPSTNMRFIVEGLIPEMSLPAANA